MSESKLPLRDSIAAEIEKSLGAAPRFGLPVADRILALVAEQSKGPAQMRGAIAPGELGDDEPCRRCYVRRGEHDAVTTHDYEAIFLYTCEGCSPDVAWTSENLSEHPDYDHDLDWIPLDMDDRERPRRIQQADGSAILQALKVEADTLGISVEEAIETWLKGKYPALAAYLPPYKKEV